MEIDELRTLVRTLIIQGCSLDEWKEKTGMSRATMFRLKKNMGLTRAYGVVENE